MTGSILVFGAGGQLGQEISASADKAHTNVFTATRETANILDANAVAQLIRVAAPCLIVNCAAYTAVDKAESEPEAAAATNIRGAEIVAREAATADIPLVHLSTDYVFDGTKDGAYIEPDPIAPLNIYGLTKAEGEERVRVAAPRHIILRTSWIYGRFGHNFVKTILRVSHERPELRIVSDQHGCPTATQDLAGAIFAIAKLAAGSDNIEWGTYHFAGGEATTWFGFANEIVAAQANRNGFRPRVTAITTDEFPTPARRPQNSELDSSRFANAFGYRAMPWRERVAETVGTLLE